MADVKFEPKTIRQYIKMNSEDREKHIGSYVQAYGGRAALLRVCQAILPVILALGIALGVYILVMHLRAPGLSGHAIFQQAWHWVTAAGTHASRFVEIGVPVLSFGLMIFLGIAAQERHYRYAEENEEESGEKGSKLKTINLIGMHNNKTAVNAGLISDWDYRGYKLKALVGHNLGILGGYLPVIGIIAGSNKLNSSIRSKKYFSNKLSKGARSYFRIRGTLEMLGLGIVFLIPDIICTVANVCRKDKNVVTHLGGGDSDSDE